MNPHPLEFVWMLRDGMYSLVCNECLDRITKERKGPAATGIVNVRLARGIGQPKCIECKRIGCPTVPLDGARRN